MISKWLDLESLVMATEKAMRSRWVSGVREAARQMSRILWGFCSDLRRESADRVFDLAESGVVEFWERIDVEKKWWWVMGFEEVRDWRRREMMDMVVVVVGLRD